jgi:mono/diheme cytochrome c family protein
MMQWTSGLALVFGLGCGSGSSSSPVAEAEPAAQVAPAPAPKPTHPADAYEGLDLSTLTGEESLAKRMEIGEFVYKKGGRKGLACLTCHQANGQGLKGAFPPLVGQREHMGDCAKHATTILDGLQGELVVDDVTYNGVMVPQRELLTDLEIASVMTYERSSWGNDFGACLPSDVAALR